MSETYISASARLSYTTWGAGTPIVFLHPTPLDSDYWRPLAHLLPGVRAIVPDLRGHGASELEAPNSSTLPIGDFPLVPDAPVLSMSQYATDVIALLDHLKIQQAIFAGCSIGGYILLELWSRIPSRIQGLAFVCSKPQPDTDQGRAKRTETIAKARTEGISALFDGMAQALIGATTRQLHPEVVSQLRSRMTLTPEALVAVQAGLATRPDSIPTVATITAPILAIAGTEDTVIPPADMEAFQSAPGRCTYHVLNQAGHFAAYEQPQAVAVHFSAWLTQFK